MKTHLLRTLALGSAGLSMLLSSCVVDPYAYGTTYRGYPGAYGPGYRPPPAEGAVAGALLGAAAGGIIGNQSSRGLEGAAIGGLLGALAGSAIQNSRQHRFAQPCYTAPGYYNTGTCDPYYGSWR